MSSLACFSFHNHKQTTTTSTMQPSTEIMTYQNPHVTDNDVPIVTSIRPPTTAGQRSKRMIAVVAAGIMLVAGVVLVHDGGSSYHHLSRIGSIASTAEGFVVAPPIKCGSCYGAGVESECCDTCDDVEKVGDPILFDFILLFWPSI